MNGSGGCCWQELALMMMDRGIPPSTVTLACTHSGGWRLLPPLPSLPLILHLLLAVTTRARIQRVLPLHHHENFLKQPAAVAPQLAQEPPANLGPSEGAALTESDYLVEEYLERSPFKGSLLEFATGLVGHFIATARHYVSADRLRRLGVSVHRGGGASRRGGPEPPRCLVIAAKQDRLIPPEHSQDLAVAIGGRCEFVEFTENGHMVNLERVDEFNALIRNHIGRAAGGSFPRCPTPPLCFVMDE
jgi:pimeloyl-ACP methyl ester carboxylesterase